MHKTTRLLAACLGLHIGSHIHASWQEYIIPVSGIAAASSVLGWGIYQYRIWSEHRNAEDIYTQTYDALTHIQEKYQPLINAWQQRDAYAYADLVRHMLATLEPFEDGLAELEAQITTLDTLLHRAQSVYNMDSFPALTSELERVIAYGKQTQTALQEILTHCTRNYGQFMLYDTLHVSRHLLSYYQMIITYNEQYPDPDRRQYVDTALMSQYASARLNWPRLYAVDQMHQHIKAIERGWVLTQQETDTQSAAPEHELNRNLLQTAEYLLYHLKDIHMYLATLPGYHAERDGYYQEQREKEHEARIQKQYEQKVQAERDRAQAERNRAEAEEQRAQEARRSNKLREKALQWGIDRLPELQSKLEQLSDACRNNTISRQEMQQELADIIRHLPTPQSSIAIGIQLLMDG